MSRTSRVIAGVSIGYLQLALSSVFALWFTPFLLRRVGTAEFGLWSAGMPILGYVALVDFGVLTIFQREVAFALGEAEGQPARIRDLRGIVGTTRGLVLLQMPVLMAGIAVVWLRLPQTWTALRLPLGVLLGCFAATFPMRIYHALLIGLQDLKFVGLLALGSWAAGALASVVLLLLGWRLNALAASWSLSQLITYGGCYLRARVRFPASTGTSPTTLSRTEARARLGKGFWVIVSQVAVLMSNGTDLLVIAAVLGPAAATPYTITDKLVTMAAGIPPMIMSAAQPALSELSSGSSRHRLGDVSVALTRVILLMSGAIAAVVITVNEGFIGVWIGPQQFGGRLLLYALTADMVISHWTTATAYGLFSFGYERLLSITSVLTGVAVLAGTVVLTKQFGLIGAPLASSATRLFFALPVFLVATARATGGNLRTIVASTLPWAWRFAILVGAGAFVARRWMPRSWVEIVAWTLASGLAYSSMMAPVLLSGPLGEYARPRLAALRRRFGPA